MRSMEKSRSHVCVAGYPRSPTAPRTTNGLHRVRCCRGQGTEQHLVVDELDGRRGNLIEGHPGRIQESQSNYALVARMFINR